MTPELLAPVADAESCAAAIHNGADAIYIGLPGFNARARAPQLDDAEYQSILRLCRDYGVRLHLAANILVQETELPDALLAIRRALDWAPDAIILQDLGLARLVRSLAPEQEIHASTQMSLASAPAIHSLRDLNLARVILARELRLDQIAQIRAQLPEMPLEVFVQGALCIAFSGQCQASRTTSGRSGNRGQCAQNCRLPYQMQVDGRQMQTASALLSPRDLCGLEQIPELCRLGIASLKIEGRLKSPEYVAACVRSYRQALDQWRASGGQSVSDTEPQHGLLERRFNRGFSSGWLGSCTPGELVPGDSVEHRGQYLGSICTAGRNRGLPWIEARIAPQMAARLARGQGLLILGAQRQFQTGAPLHQIQKANGRHRLALGPRLDWRGIQAGDQLFLSSDPAEEQDLRRSWTDRDQWRRIGLCMELSGRSGQPLQLAIRTSDGRHRTQVDTSEPLQPALQSPRQDRLRKELATLTNSPFALDELHLDLPEPLFIEQRQLRQLRRRALEALLDQRRNTPTPGCRDLSQPLTDLTRLASAIPVPSQPRLHLLIQHPEQLDILASLPATWVASLILDPHRQHAPRELARAMTNTGLPLSLASPRMHLPGDQIAPHSAIVDLASHLVLRHPGFLPQCPAGVPLTGDRSLNIANAASAHWWLQRGCQRIAPCGETLDLGWSQARHLARPAQIEWPLRMIAEGFHMQFCLYDRHLGPGRGPEHCMEPCRQHQLQLLDPRGQQHHIRADWQCRNTSLQHQPTDRVSSFGQVWFAGVRDFRMEFAEWEKPHALRTEIERNVRIIRRFVEEDAAQDA